MIDNQLIRETLDEMHEDLSGISLLKALIQTEGSEMISHGENVTAVEKNINTFPDKDRVT